MGCGKPSSFSHVVGIGGGGARGIVVLEGPGSLVELIYVGFIRLPDSLISY